MSMMQRTTGTSKGYVLLTKSSCSISPLLILKLKIVMFNSPYTKQRDNLHMDYLKNKFGKLNIKEL